jgi:transposase InsO family protein
LKGDIIMSRKELDRVKILEQYKQGKLNIVEAGELLMISRRQLYRQVKRYEENGDKGVIHGLRGKESNRGYSKEVKRKILAIYRSQYNDYGATLFSEKLLEYHKYDINRETLRLWLKSEGINTGMRKGRKHRKKRQRRSGFGELLQFDGSPHDWFEGRGAECCLLHAIDDATGRIFLRFARSENSHDAMQTMWEYIIQYGVPRSLYTDHGSVYYAEERKTDFARAMEELGCQIIFANTPQAKGRVERGNRTHQDRLIKALREKGISCIGEANEFLRQEYIAHHNTKFSVNPEAVDVHYASGDADLKNIFCYKTQRQVRNDYTITLDGVYIQLLRGETPLPRTGQYVQVHIWLDGSLHIFNNESELKFQVLSSKPKTDVPKLIKPRADHPWRAMNKMLQGTKAVRRVAATLG